MRNHNTAINKPDTKLNILQQRLGYRFQDLKLLQKALTPKSMSASAASQNNERLEFLGDRVLGLSLADLLQTFLPEAGVGELSDNFIKHARNDAKLCALGREFNLADFTGKSGVKSLADTVEALIGAIFIDSKRNYSLVKAFIAKHWAIEFGLPARNVLPFYLIKKFDDEQIIEGLLKLGLKPNSTLELEGECQNAYNNLVFEDIKNAMRMGIRDTFEVALGDIYDFEYNEPPYLDDFYSHFRVQPDSKKKDSAEKQLQIQLKISVKEIKSLVNKSLIYVAYLHRRFNTLKLLIEYGAIIDQECAKKILNIVESTITSTLDLIEDGHILSIKDQEEAADQITILNYILGAKVIDIDSNVLKEFFISVFYIKSRDFKGLRPELLDKLNELKNNLFNFIVSKNDYELTNLLLMYCDITPNQDLSKQIIIYKEMRAILPQILGHLEISSILLNYVGIDIQIDDITVSDSAIKLPIHDRLNPAFKRKTTAYTTIVAYLEYSQFKLQNHSKESLLEYRKTTAFLVMAFKAYSVNATTMECIIYYNKHYNPIPFLQELFRNKFQIPVNPKFLGYYFLIKIHAIHNNLNLALELFNKFKEELGIIEDSQNAVTDYHLLSSSYKNVIAETVKDAITLCSASFMLSNEVCRLIAEYADSSSYELAEEFNQQGVIFFNNKEYSKAIVVFSKAEGLSFSNPLPDVFYHRGSAYHKRGELEMAMRDYQESLKSDPNHVSACYQLGICFLRRNNLPKAETYLEHALLVDPKFEMAQKALDKIVKSTMSSTRHLTAASDVKYGGY